MFRIVRALGLCLLVSASLFAQARVRVVHASPDAPKVDILLGVAGGPAPQIAIEALPYGEYTDYIEVPAATYNAAINVSGTDTQVIALPLTLENGMSYTVVAIGFAGGNKTPSFRVTAVPETRTDAPPQDFSYIRFVHAAPSVPDVSVYALPFAFATARNSNALVPSLPFGVTTGYERVPAGNYFARLTPVGSKTILADAGRLTLPSQSVRTVVALDTGFLVLPD